MSIMSTGASDCERGRTAGQKPRIVRISVAQQMLSISRPKIYDLVAQKRLVLLHIDKSSFITMESIEALIAAAIESTAPRQHPNLQQRKRGRPRKHPRQSPATP